VKGVVKMVIAVPLWLACLCFWPLIDDRRLFSILSWKRNITVAGVVVCVGFWGVALAGFVLGWLVRW
jgi:hypothetical protein